MDDIVAASRAHIASLPPHLKDRYSAKLICKLIAKVLLLQELREQDRCTLTDKGRAAIEPVDFGGLTDAEREAIEAAIATEHERGAWQWADTLRNLLTRLA